MHLDHDRLTTTTRSSSAVCCWSIVRRIVVSYEMSIEKRMIVSSVTTLLGSIVVSWSTLTSTACLSKFGVGILFGRFLVAGANLSLIPSGYSSSHFANHVTKENSHDCLVIERFSR